MRQYVLSVICGSLICGTVLGLVPEGMVKAVVKLLCGAFLAVTVIMPLTRLDFDPLPEFLLPDSLNAEGLTAAGENMARRSRAAIIKQSSESYILDKAAVPSEALWVEITVDEENSVPVAAELSGRVSPNDKARIERILQTDLGIPKENVRWTLLHGSKTG